MRPPVKTKTRAAARPATRSEAGARARKLGVGDRWHSYLDHHRSSAGDSLRRLLATPLQSLMTWMVIAVALALPATLLVGMDNLRSLGQRWDGAPKLSVFVSANAREPAITDLRRQLQQNPLLAEVTFITPEQALQDFERESGMGQALRLLDSNPLPATLLLVPALSVPPQELIQLGDSLRASAVVDDVVFDRDWVERLHRILALGTQLVWVLGGLLALGVLLVIGNTIRLAIESRRDEIIIIKLVGGSNAFVRRPFLYTGFWYGFAGGVLGLLLLLLLLLLLAGPVSSLAAAYQSDFRLLGPDLTIALLMLGGGALMGWLGAWLAVSRHLGEIEPR